MSEPASDDWRHYARCLTEDPELFFVIGTSGPVVEAQTEQAKAVCRQCPVVASCLAEAMADARVTGIWGATTEDERKTFRRRLSRQARAEVAT